MEKNTESYEYLPSNDAEADCDQFFIIEDDGTFLTYKPIQYVTQVQEDKTSLDDVQSQPTPVYDVTSQQLLIGVDNSNEQILSDNSILPHGSAENSLHCNSYFIQTTANTSDQVDNNVDGSQVRQNDMQIMETNSHRQNTTEIMLTDEQYSILEQKGWILLELNNRVFVLDTTGLQDITNSHELIQQLKAEMQSAIELYSRTVDKNETSKIKLEMDTSLDFSTSQSKSKLETDNSVQKDAMSLNKTMETDELEGNKDISVIKTDKDVVREKVNDIQAHTIGDTIRIKTKLLLTDIPEKIVLGKTINGKNLVAKFVPKQVSTETKTCKNNPGTPKHTKLKPSKHADTDVSALPDWQFNALVEYAQSNDMRCSEDHVASAKHVVGQLLQIAAFQRAVAGKNIFITRAIKNNSENLLSETVTQSVVPGIISEIDGEQQFVHIPNMMLSLAETGDKDPHNITHVHVTETKKQNSTQTMSISITRRPLPPVSPKCMRQRKVYACSTCASLFSTEKELLDHQDAHCIDAEDSLTIDTGEISNIDQEESKISPYCILKTDKGIIYSCLKCPSKFNKLCNCRRHVKTHLRPTTAGGNNNDEDISIEKTYKCKMCSSSYYYASTLSKHIVSAHINVNSSSASS